MRHLPLVSALELSAESGFSGFDIWIDKQDEYLDQGGTYNDLKCLIEKLSIKIIGIAFLNDWIELNGDSMTEKLVALKKMCWAAVHLKVATVTVVAVGGCYDSSVAVKNFREIYSVAGAYDLKVAFEYFPSNGINTVLDAWKIIEDSKCDNAGLIVDSFHFFKGSSELSDLDKIPAGRIFNVHLNDLVSMNCNEDLVKQAREMRILPGYGVFPLSTLVSKLKDVDYEGYYSLEILNKDLHKQPVREMVKSGYQSMIKLI